MKKTIAIFFLFLFTSTTTEFRELYRLPLLVEHFVKHKEADSSMSLTDFFKIHYVGEEQNDNDDQDDGELPFKNIPERIISFIFTADHSLASAVQLPSSGFLHQSYYQLWAPSNFGNSIFRPPRIA